MGRGVEEGGGGGVGCFFNDTATTEIYTLSLHDALPILVDAAMLRAVVPLSIVALPDAPVVFKVTAPDSAAGVFKAIVPLVALVVKDEVPEIARATVSVMFPVVAVTLRFPPTVPSVEELI